MVHSVFVTKFYNLQGDAVSERKKNFSNLLNAQSVPLKEEDLEGLHPRTYLEKLFEIDILIHFNLSARLLNVIKDGNPVFICKILKHPHILKTALGNISAEKFVNDFLPCTSYIIRMKILKKMSFFLDESHMDEIIFWVHKRYGLNIALKILHTGSSNKIKEYLSNHEVMLKPRQVKFIFNKDPELLEVYLNHYKKLTGNIFHHEDLFKYIAQQKPDFWLDLKKKQLVNTVRVGRKTTKYIIDHNNDFINNIEQYSKFLRLDIMVRQLKENFKDVYINFFPKDISKLNIDDFSSKLLKYYPKKKQWNMFQQVFLEVYQKDVADNLFYLNYNYLQRFPKEINKTKWAEAQYENDKNKSDKFLRCCSTNKALPLIKEKINVTSNLRKRYDLVRLLVQNCGENKDTVALESVLEYIWVRHRNEDTIITSILGDISHWFELGTLNDTHWNYINKIITFLKLSNRLSHNGHTYILQYIEFLFLHGKPYKNELMTFLRNVHVNDNSFDIYVNSLELKKQLFIEIINIYINENEFGDDFEIITLLYNIINFNESHPEHKIDLSSFPSVVLVIEALFNKSSEDIEWKEREILHKVIKSNLKFSETPIITMSRSQILNLFQNDSVYRNFDDEIKDMITKHNRSDFENDLLQLFWDKLGRNYYNVVPVVRWLIKNEPRTVFPHIEEIFTIRHECFSLSRVKLMSHLNLDKKLIDYCTEKLEHYFRENTNCVSSDTNSTDITKDIKPTLDSKIIKTLSALMPTSKYIEMVEERFIPINGGIENADESFNKIYLLQCEIARSFKATQESITTLPTLMKFCLGDFLQSALPSLYGISYITPEKMLYPFVDLLSKRTISVKKHALYLSSELLDFNATVKFLENTNESSLSIQKHIVSATLTYFRKNPCETLLNMVLENLNKINKNDVETLTELVKIKLPRKYTDFYIQKCWYFLESLGEDVDVKSYLESFLKSIISSEDMITSSAQLCKHIITRYFKELPENGQNLQNIYQFVAMVLRYQTSDAMYAFIFDIISEFKKNQKIKPIKKVFGDFYYLTLADIESNKNIDAKNNFHVELFKQHWFNIFTSVEMFDEYFLLNLLYIKCKSGDKMENYIKNIVDYLEELVAQYGLHIFNKLKNLLSKHVYSGNDKHVFLYNMLLYKNSTLNCILTLDLLNKWISFDEKIKDVHQKIIQIIRTSNDPVVSVYLNSYINDE